MKIKKNLNEAIEDAMQNNNANMHNTKADAVVPVTYKAAIEDDEKASKSFAQVMRDRKKAAKEAKIDNKFANNDMVVKRKSGKRNYAEAARKTRRVQKRLSENRKRINERLHKLSDDNREEFNRQMFKAIADVLWQFNMKNTAVTKADFENFLEWLDSRGFWNDYDDAESDFYEACSKKSRKNKHLTEAADDERAMYPKLIDKFLKVCGFRNGGDETLVRTPHGFKYANQAVKYIFKYDPADGYWTFRFEDLDADDSDNASFFADGENWNEFLDTLVDNALTVIYLDGFDDLYI